MQMVALQWLVYSFSGANAFTLGAIGFASQIPSFLLSPFGGLAADRFNRRRLLLVTQTLLMLQAFVLAVIVLHGVAKIWHVFLLSVFAGVVASFDMPTRQSFVIDLTEDKEILANAIALNSSMFNSARLIGPWVAGALIAEVGTGMCFLINACSFLAVLGCLVAMRIPHHSIARSSEPIKHRLLEGFRYAMGFPPLRAMILLLVVVSFVGMPYTVLMPVYAKTILGGGPKTLGLLFGASGLGALAGALFLAARKSVLGLGKWIPLAGTIFGAGLMAFAYSRSIPLSCILLTITGFGMIVGMASSNTIIQTVVDEDKRGRVMSIYTMAFLGAGPFGSLLAGKVAVLIGPPLTVMIAGATVIASAGVFALKLPELRDHVRPIYTTLGIIPTGITGQSVAPVAMSSQDDDDKESSDSP
jgi:MFS family permease